MFHHLSFCEICRTVRSVDSWIMLSYFFGFWGIIYAGAAVLIRTPTYIFPRYVPCIFPCVFLNLWSQEKTSPYRKITFLFLSFQILHLSILLVFCWLHKISNTQGKIHGTYLGNIYGIYKECITNISIDIYDITINIHQYIHQTHRRRLRRRPNGAAAFGGRPIGDYIINIHGYISYTRFFVVLTRRFDFF